MRRMFVAGLVLLAASLARLPVPEGRPSRARRTARRGRAGRRARAAHGAPGDEARELRGGVELVMRFEQPAERFTGTVRNTTKSDRPRRAGSRFISRTASSSGRPRESIRAAARPVRSSSTRAAVGYGRSDGGVRTGPRPQRQEDELPSGEQIDPGVNELPSVALTTKFLELCQQYGSEQLAVRIVAAGRSTGVPGLPQSSDWTAWNADEMRAAVEHLQHKRGR